MKLTARELATILAALRKFQELPSVDTGHFADCPPLAPEEIDRLCERLN